MMRLSPLTKLTGSGGVMSSNGHGSWTLRRKACSHTAVLIRACKLPGAGRAARSAFGATSKCLPQINSKDGGPCSSQPKADPTVPFNLDACLRGEAEPTSPLSQEAQRWTPLHGPSVKTALVLGEQWGRRGPTCPSSQPSLSSPPANPNCTLVYRHSGT